MYLFLLKFKVQILFAQLLSKTNMLFPKTSILLYLITNRNHSNLKQAKQTIKLKKFFMFLGLCRIQSLAHLYRHPKEQNEKIGEVWKAREVRKFLFIAPSPVQECVWPLPPPGVLWKYFLDCPLYYVNRVEMVSYVNETYDTTLLNTSLMFSKRQ